jgi:hypothetical protein
LSVEASFNDVSAAVPQRPGPTDFDAALARDFRPVIDKLSPEFIRIVDALGQDQRAVLV